MSNFTHDAKPLVFNCERWGFISNKLQDNEFNPGWIQDSGTASPAAALAAGKANPGGTDEISIQVFSFF